MGRPHDLRQLDIAAVAQLHAAGDAIEGLDQISMAMGTAAQAAVTIHNDLRDREGATDKGRAAGDAAWKEPGED